MEKLKTIAMKVTSICIMVVMILTLNGCAMYDWLCGWIQTAFSTSTSYEVSVIDCKHFKVPDGIINITPKLSTKLSDSVREGVIEVGRLPKFPHIKLVDKIPKDKFVEFQDNFFTDKTTFLERTAILRNYCEEYKTNIIIWGATMGDDAGMVFIGWMYRRDLDVITKTEPQALADKMSARVQEYTVKKSIANLLQGSLEGRPIGKDGAVADTMIDNKNTILSGTVAVLSYALKMVLSSKDSVEE